MDCNISASPTASTMNPTRNQQKFGSMEDNIVLTQPTTMINEPKAGCAQEIIATDAQPSIDLNKQDGQSDSDTDELRDFTKYSRTASWEDLRQTQIMINSIKVIYMT